MKKNNIRLIIGFLISLILFVWVIVNTDWHKIWLRLQDANWWLLVAALFAVMLNVIFRAWRWGIMLEPEDAERPFSALFDIVNLGYLANNILPARLGDLIRVYLAGEWTKVSFTFALSTTVVERVLDTLLVFMMLFGLLPFLPVSPAIAQGGVMLGVLTFIGSIVLVIAAWQRALSERLIRTCLRPLPIDEEAWGDRLVGLLDGFALVQEPLRFLRVLWSSVLVWGAAIMAYWLTFEAFNLELSFLDASFTICLAALGMAAPSGPAAAGTFEGAVIIALAVFTIPSELAGGIAIILHAVNFIGITILGFYSLFRRGLTLNSLARQAEAIGDRA